MKLTAHGIETDLPPGWEGRITVRRPAPTPPSPGDAGAPAPGPATVTRGAPPPAPRSTPVVHLANFALPEDRGDFGSGAVDIMGDGQVLVVLFEYGPESVGQALFGRQGLPTALRPAMFGRSTLQRTMPGQAGCQVFFSDQARAFCLYVVLGRAAEAPRVVPLANRTLRATRISRR